MQIFYISNNWLKIEIAKFVRLHNRQNINLVYHTNYREINNRCGVFVHIGILYSVNFLLFGMEK